MSGLEIVIILIGIAIVVISFVFSDFFNHSGNVGTLDNEAIRKVSEEIIQKEVEYELAKIIDDKVDETEARLDQISNKKTMEFGGYAENTLEEINKNHTEVMFLYDMLNEKEETVKNMVKDVEALKKSIKQMAIVSDFAGQTAKAASVKTASSKTAVKKTADVTAETKETLAGSDVATRRVAKNDEVSISAKDAAWSNKESKNNNSMILDLYKKGKSDIEIAKELGLGIGEVKVVINLFDSNSGN